ncbi:MAG: hypothetical protein C0399_04860 [Syntrophus sp. (in: bacteria)]|nr:hypothetical protein [Syntrophus sp. (in: bacteria)]
MDIQTEEYRDETNLLDYVNIILKNKILICTIVGIVVVATGIVSLLMAPVYEARAVIAPVSKTGESSGAGALAAQFGISAPASSNMSEIVNLLKTNIVREEVIKKHNLLPVLFKGKNFKNQSEEQRVWAGLRYLEGALKVVPNQKDNSIQVSMQFGDPRIATDIVSYTLIELTDHMSNEARRVADTNKKYLESQVDKTADPFIKTKIYSLIAQQMETSMMAEVKENFAFKVLDPPRVPDRKVKPKRTQMVVISFIVSLFLGIFAAFGREYWKNHRNDLKMLTNGCNK